MDNLSVRERSERMSHIRSRDTKPELLVRHFLHMHGLRYRLHAAEIVGRPDLVFPKYGVVVFVQGCFWHAHCCQKGRIPATHMHFWRTKLQTNQKRDARNDRALRRAGWRVLHVWECGLAGAKRRTHTLNALEHRIRLDPRKHRRKAGSNVREEREQDATHRRVRQPARG